MKSTAKENRKRERIANCEVRVRVELLGLSERLCGQSGQFIGVHCMVERVGAREKARLGSSRIDRRRCRVKACLCRV